MKTVAYARVSTKEQEETGYSLPAQMRLLEEYCVNKGLSIGKKFSISESASGKIQRKTFAEMLEYTLKHNINVIVCEKTDRLTRNLKDAAAVNDWMNDDPERQVHFVKENVVLSKDAKSNDKFIWNIKVSTAQYYIDNLSEEVRKGQKEKISTGWYPSAPPQGYKSEGEKGKRIHVPNPETAPFIQRIFELYATGLYSTQKLSDKMNEEGMLSKKGKPMSKRRIYEVLTNPYYTGWFRWNGKEHKGKHEPIITRELFDRVQATLKGRTVPLKTKKDHLFRGMIKCAHCGSTIGWEEHKGHIYGHCNYNYTKCDQRKWLKQEDVFKDIATAFTELAVRNPKIAEWIKKSLQASRKDSIQYQESKLKELERKLSILDKRMDRLYMDRLDEMIPDSLYKEKFELFTQEKASTLAEIKTTSEKKTDNSEIAVKVFESAQVAREKFFKKTPDGKRLMMKELCSRLEINEGRARADYTRAFELVRQAVTSTNSSEIAKIAENLDDISEPCDFGSMTTKKGSLEPLCAIWRSGPGSNRRPPP